MASPADGSSHDTARRPPEQDAHRRLESWKEIADYLGISVRTAHRWEEGNSMPLHRSPSGRVYATSAELNRWRESARRRRWRQGLLASASLLALAAIATAALVSWRAPRESAPAAVDVQGERVTVTDSAGRTCWTTTIPKWVPPPDSGWEVSVPARTLVDDLDGDGAREVLVNVAQDDPDAESQGVLCFSSDGRRRWAFVPGRAFEDAGGSYSLHYNAHILKPVRIDGRPFLLVAATHRLWHPCQVALLDVDTGHVVEEFWHPGAITHALLTDLDRDGRDDLVLAGLNNPGTGPGEPVLMWLRLPFSRVPPVGASMFGQMSDGGPAAYAVLRRPDVLTAQGGLTFFIRLDVADAGRIVAHGRYARSWKHPQEGFAAVSYLFDARFDLVNLFTPLQMTALHNAEWKAGVLDHPFGDEDLLALRRVVHFSHVPDAGGLTRGAAAAGR